MPLGEKNLKKCVYIYIYNENKDIPPDIKRLKKVEFNLVLFLSLTVITTVSSVGFIECTRQHPLSL